MLKFVRRVRSHVHSDHGPMVVHCSAGVGRTGTFIAIDVMLQKLAVGEALNIQEFVFQMRAQRNHMVQTNVRVTVCVGAWGCGWRCGTKEREGMYEEKQGTVTQFCTVFTGSGYSQSVSVVNNPLPPPHMRTHTCPHTPTPTHAHAHTPRANTCSSMMLYCTLLTLAIRSWAWLN